MKLGTRQAKAIYSALYDLGLRFDFPADHLGLGGTLAFKPVKPKRSLEQNARYWKIVSALADFIGLTRDEMHDEVLAARYGYELVEFRGTIKKRPLQRSSKQNKQEFSDLMAIAEMWAAEQGVAWDREAA